ncbi:MAG: hypothetical protein IJU84_03885 [Clostridia bacterium]|nr:hypothetical protein [Clostridia bacterium]MBQ9481282.1 hypothetical protein [Clostridia bacterium]
MLIFLRILLGVYTLAMNAYSFLLLKFQKDSYDEGECENAVHDGKLFIAALLGGALGIYVAMFALKYRRRSMFLMVLMPVIIVVNAYLLYRAFTGTYGLYPARYEYGAALFLSFLF